MRFERSLVGRRQVGLAAALAILVAVGIGLVVSGGADSSSEQARASGPVQVPAMAAALQTQLIHVVTVVEPSVVQIATRTGLGSGVVYDAKGDIVTNAHVVAGARTFSVTLANSAVDRATLVGSFPAGDVAVIRLRRTKPRPAAFADSSKTSVGEIALAIGNPLGLRSSVTEGIVSSLGRTVSEGNGVALPSVIQTSAPINPGNSGGALVDLSGQVIGIPTLAALDPELGGSAPGIGFAIPSNTVRNIADQLIRDGRVVRSGRAALGVRVTTIVGGGVLVAAVTRGGPAAKAGIRPGDLIVAVDHQPTPNTDALSSVLAALKPGKRVPVEVVRSGAPRTITVTLGQLSQ
jgi:putative serine protease PepD